MSYLDCLVIEPEKKATATVIWLHGLGADGHDFEPVVPELNLASHCQIRFIFPHSPKIPVTVNGGMVMPAWYDIYSMNIEREIDETQLLQSAQKVHDLIDREIAQGIASENIILAGFSQGGAVVYHAALTYDKPLAGLLVMSSYFATKDSIDYHLANRNIPIEIMHGQEDPVVPEFLGVDAAKSLTELGFKVAYKHYLMAHSVCPQQIGDIAFWLKQQIKKS